VPPALDDALYSVFRDGSNVGAQDREAWSQQHGTINIEEISLTYYFSFQLTLNSHPSSTCTLPLTFQINTEFIHDSSWQHHSHLLALSLLPITKKENQSSPEIQRCHCLAPLVPREASSPHSLTQTLYLRPIPLLYLLSAQPLSPARDSKGLSW